MLRKTLHLLRLIAVFLLVAVPVLCVVKLMSWVHTPVLWLAGLFGNRARDWMDDQYTLTGLRLYWLMIFCKDGKTAANLAILQVMLEAFTGESHE